MQNKLEDKVKKQIVTSIEHLLEESWMLISSSIDKASMEASMAGKEKFKFPVGIRASIEPMGDDCRVEVGMSWGTRCKLTSEPVTVSAQPELPIK